MPDALPYLSTVDHAVLVHFVRQVKPEVSRASTCRSSATMRGSPMIIAVSGAATQSILHRGGDAR